MPADDGYGDGAESRYRLYRGDELVTDSVGRHEEDCHRWGAGPRLCAPALCQARYLHTSGATVNQRQPVALCGFASRTARSGFDRM